MYLHFSYSSHFLLCTYACSFAQSCTTLCNPLDCSLPRSSIHGIFWARILDWVAIFYSRGIFPGIESKSPAWQADSLSLSHLGSPPQFSSVNSVTQSCLTLCHPMDCSMPGLPVALLFTYKILFIYWTCLFLPLYGVVKMIAVGNCFMGAHEICWYANKIVYATVIPYLSIFCVENKLDI